MTDTDSNAAPTREDRIRQIVESCEAAIAALEAGEVETVEVETVEVETSQAQWLESMLKRAKSVTGSLMGGYVGEPEKLEIFQHGMQTIVNMIEDTRPLPSPMKCAVIAGFAAANKRVRGELKATEAQLARVVLMAKAAHQTTSALIGTIDNPTVGLRANRLRLGYDDEGYLETSTEDKPDNVG
jgi:hypothetical protein